MMRPQRHVVVVVVVVVDDVAAPVQVSSWHSFVKSMFRDEESR